jgi:mannose-6-phosphate isomerase-like protein (cupin superfamily)
MDLEEIKSSIVTNVYHIKADKKVALHQHRNCNELFYCIKGEGFGVLENDEINLTIGKVFIVPAGTMHALRTDSNMWVTSFLIPAMPEK